MRRKTEEKSPERSSRKGSGFLSLLKKSEQLFFRLLAFFWILFARTYRLFKKTEYGQWLTGKIEPWASLMKDIATILFEKFQSLNAWKKALVSLTIIALIFQSSFMDRWNINLFAWADEKDPLEAIATPEMKELSQVNPDLIQSDNFQKAKKVNELINDEKKDIDYFLGIFPKSKEDAVKGQEVAILKDAKNRMRGGWLSQSKALEETVIRYSNSTNSRTKEAAEKIRELLKQKGLFNSFYDNEEQKEKEISTNLKKEDDTLKPQSVPFEAEIQNSFNQGDSISDLSQGTGTDPADRTDDNGITEPTTIKVTTEAGDKYLTDNTPEFQEKVQIKPLGANPSVGQLADNKVLFKDVFTGVDMLKSVEQTGLKDNYIFKNDTASQEMKFQIATTGLTMRINDQGGMDFYDIFNQLKFTSPRPFIQDKDGNRKDLKYAKDEDSLVQSLTFSSPNEKVERQNILNALSNNQALEALKEELVLNDNALNGATQEIAQMLGKSTRYVANLFSPSEIKDIMGITGPSSVDLTQSPIFEDATKERTYTVSIKMDFDKMSYPINLDPTISINLQDMGEATFYGDYSQGSTYGKQGFMNGYGSETRSSESFLPKGSQRGYVPMDSTWNDYSGNGYNLTASGNAANTASGKFSQAGTFDGTDDYVYSTNAGYNIPGLLTYSAWFKTSTSSFGSNGLTIANMGNTPVGQWRRLYVSSASQVCMSASNILIACKNTSSPINDGAWHHVAAVFGGTASTSNTLYVDGVAQSGTATVNTFSTFQGFYVGTNTDLSDDFNGQIDEMTVWARNLSEAEVAQIYNNGRVENTDPRVTYVDQDGTRIQGKVGTDATALATNSNWYYTVNAGHSNGSAVYYNAGSLGDVGKPGNEKAYIEHTFTGTEIWGGFVKNNLQRFIKVIVDEGTANELVNYIDLYNPNSANLFQQKVLFATGLSNGSHVVRVYLQIGKDIGSSPAAANSFIGFDYFEYYTSGYELAKKSDITINSRTTSGMDFTNTKDSPAISYDAKGNVPANTSGNQDKGTWSSWIKTDFDWNADNAPHYVWSNENARLYYLYDGLTNGNWYYEMYNGTNWTTVQVKSADYTLSNNFLSGQTFHLAASWDVTIGASLYVNNNKTSYSGSWTPQAMTGNMKVGGDEKTKLLLHADGPDGDARDVDGSGNGYPLTFNGDAKTSTAQSKFGGSSYAFDGTGDYVSSPDSEDWNFGNGDFTIDFWARYSEDPNTNTVGFVSQTTDANNRIVTSSVNSGGQTQVGLAAVSGGTILANYYFQETLSTNTWYHFAFVRQGSNVYMFRDGVSKTLTVSTAIGSNSFPNLSSNVDIGRAYNSAWSELNGFMDEVRITKGQARWTGNFTPPTGPYHSNMIIAEPAIFNYQLTDVEINSIYKSNVSMGDMLSGKTPSSNAETNQGLFNPGKRIEEVSQTTKSLLFNFPGVQTADARVGSYAGSLYKTTAPTNPTTAAAMNDVNWVGKWNTCATGNCKYTDDPNAYATYTTATNATELWATYNAYADYAIAEYIIDEGTAKEVRTKIDQYYNSTARDQYALIATGLENTTHTIKVRWSGSKNPAANYNRIIVGLGATANKLFLYGTNPDIATQNMVVNGKTVPNVLTQDYTTMGNAVNFVPKGNISNSANEGTISIWVQTSWAGNDSANHYVVATGGAALANGFYINKNTSNQLVFYFYNASAGVNIGSSAFDASTWAPNVPHHIVAKWWRPTSTTFGMALYFDGKKVAENKSQSLTPSFNTNFILGNSSPTPSEASDFDGSLYDLSVWSWAFSDGDTAIGAMAKPTSDVGKSYSGYALVNDEDLSSQADGSETTFKLTHNLVPNQPDDSDWIASGSAKSLSGSGANGNNLVYDSARSRWYTAYSNYLYYSSSADLDTASWTPVYLGTTANFGVRKIYYDSANSLWYMVGYITGTYSDSYVWVSSSSDPVSSTWTRKNLYAGSNNEWVQSMAYDSVNSRWLAVGYLRVEPASAPIQAWLAYSSGSDLSTATWGTSSIQTSASNQQAYDIIYDSNNSLWYVVGGYYPGSANYGVLWYSNNPTGGTSAWTMTTIESGGTPLAASIIYDQNSDRYLVSGYTYSTNYDTTLWYSSGSDLTSATWTKKLIDQSSTTAYGFGIVYDDLKDKFYIVDGTDNYFWPGEIAADSSLSLKDSVSVKSEGASATVSSAKAGGFAKLENPSGGNLSSNDTSITIDPGKSDTNTKLLLHGDGYNGQKSSIDDSARQNIATHNGDAQISTSQSKFGGASYSFDGTGDYISFQDSSDWALGNSNFTIESWVRLNSIGSAQDIVSQRTDANNYMSFNLQNNASIGLRFALWSGGSNIVSLQQGSFTGWTTGQWYHVAVVRNGNSWSLYRDGSLLAGITNSSAYPDYSGSLQVGAYNASSEFINGYLDEFRLSNTARWTSNFTPDNSPYPDTSYDTGSNIDTSGGYLTIGTPGSNKKPETVEYSSYNASTNTFTISQRGANGTQATSWPNDTPIEVGGTITLSSAPASGSKLLASYNTQSDEVARDRGIIKERLNKVNPLDYTASASTGWALSGDSSAKSGRQQLSTQVAGQNLFGYFEGTDLSYLYSGDSTNGGVSQIIIDEGTSQERKIRSDQNNTITNQSFDNLTSGLSKGYHTARIVGGVDETNAGSNKYTTFDAFLSQNKADLGSPTGNTGSNESKEGNDVNDTQYYPAANDNDNNAGYAMNNDSNTVLLLHNDGTNGGATFVDSSPSAKTVTNSNASISTAQSKFGGASGSFNGTSSYLSLADSSDWDFGSGDFTIDGWAYYNSFDTGARVIAGQFDGGTARSWSLYTQNNLIIFDYYNSGGTRYSPYVSWTASISQWYHIAVTRSGNNLYFFVNGNQIGAIQSISQTIRNGDAVMTVGALNAGGMISFMTGYIDELRITKGLARWTSNFEPPTQAYAPTTLLLHGDGTNGQTQVSDSSGNNKTITNSNTTISTAQAKFGGGSLSFNGAGSYVTVPDNNDWYFSTKDFTIDFWTRFNSTAGCQMFVNQGTGLSSYFQLDYCSGNLNFDVHSSGGNALVGTPYTFNTNTWYHIALVKSGGIAYLYVNGVLATSGASQVIDDWSANLLIGVNFYGFMGGTYDYFNGYLDDFRITKGTARWTSNFTPPISPYNLTEDSRDSSYWLNSNIGASDSSITFKSETADSLDKLGQPSGVIYTGSEYIRYQSIGIDKANRTASLTNLTRGYNDSTAASHNSGDNVYTKGAWRNNSQARNTSWYKEYGPFPEKALLVGTGTEGSIKGNLSIVDLSNNSTYMKLDANANNAVQAGVKTVSAAEGKIFTGYGTGDSGLTELDFINDQTLNHGADIGGRGYKGTISQANDQKGWASGYDPDPYTKLLIHADGNNASTAFTDSSSSNRTITATNTTISNVQKKFGGSSAVFNGSSSNLSAPSNSDFAYGTENFTLDAWVNFTALPASGSYMFFYNQLSSGQLQWAIYNNAGTYQIRVYLDNNAGGITNSNINIPTPSTGVWNHFALVKYNNNFKQFMNGVQQGGDIYSPYSIPNYGTAVYFGSTGNSQYYLNGYMDEIRVTKGQARWTSNFAPPSQSYGGVETISPSNDSYNKLLLHADGTNGSTIFTDSSATRKQTGSVNSTVSTAQSKFGGSSSYLNGSNAFLSLSDSVDWNFAAGDFSIDFWMNPSVVNPVGDHSLFIQPNGSAYAPVTLLIRNSKLVLFGSTTGANWDISPAAGSNTILASNWYHVAVVRNGTSLKVYLNGTQEISANVSSSTLYDSPGNFQIGIGGAGSQYYNGYLDEFRVSKGLARWTGNFTPPTLPYKYGDYVNDISASYDGKQYNVWASTGTPENSGSTMSGTTYLSSDSGDTRIGMAYDLVADSNYYSNKLGYDSTNNAVFLSQTNGTANQDIWSKISTGRFQSDSTIDSADGTDRLTGQAVTNGITTDPSNVYFATDSGVKKATKSALGSGVIATLNSGTSFLSPELTIDRCSSIDYDSTLQKLLMGFSPASGHTGVLISSDTNGDNPNFFDYFGETDPDRNNNLVSDIFRSVNWIPGLMSSYTSFATGTDQGVSLINYQSQSQQGGSGHSPRPPAVSPSSGGFLVF